MTSRYRWVAILSLLVVSCIGCAPSNRDMLQFLQEHEQEVSAIEYRVGIPDRIAVESPRIEEVDGESQTIHPDGKISLKLLGDVKVAGMTAKEIAAKLEVLLSKYYVEPKVSVRILTYASKKYYVYGPVSRSGPRPYTGRDTLLDAVLDSGINQMAWTSRVKVIRPTHTDDEPETIVVNVSKMLREGDWSRNILLEPDDVVYIPPTPLAWVGLKISELLLPVNPVIEAYQAPGRVKRAEDIYDDDRYGNNNDNRNRGRRSVIGR